MSFYSDQADVPEGFWVLAEITLLAERGVEILSGLEDELSVVDMDLANECGAAWVELESFQEETEREALGVAPGSEISFTSIGDDADLTTLADAYLAYAGPHILQKTVARLRDFAALAIRAGVHLTKNQTEMAA